MLSFIKFVVTIIDIDYSTVMYIW